MDEQTSRALVDNLLGGGDDRQWTKNQNLIKEKSEILAELNKRKDVITEELDDLKEKRKVAFNSLFEPV